MASRSEFADAYKLKPDVLEKRNARLQRRSIEWKKQRYEEVGKRRKIDLENLSPLQEQDQNVSNLSKVYEEKTPVKAPTVDKGSKSKTKETVSQRTQRLLLWKQEKEKKKAAEKAKKKPFKVSGVQHKDLDVFCKNKDSIKNIKAKVPINTTASKPSIKQRKEPVAPAPAPTQKPVTRSQPIRATTTQKSTAPPTKTTQPKHQQTIRVTRQTRSAAKLKSSPKGPTRTAVSRVQKATKNKSITAEKKASPEYDINLHKVSTLRGASFAPNDFTFEAPDSIKSFAFQPLSPASAASFLDPNRDLTSTSFFSHEPPVGRCSTPKTHEEEPEVQKTDTTLQDSGDSDQDSTTVNVKRSIGRSTRSRSAHSSISTSESESDTGSNVTAVKVGSARKTKPVEKNSDSENAQNSAEASVANTSRSSRRKSVRQETQSVVSKEATPSKTLKLSGEKDLAAEETDTKASGSEDSEEKNKIVMEKTEVEIDCSEFEKKGDSSSEEIAQMIKTTVKTPRRRSVRQKNINSDNEEPDEEKPTRKTPRRRSVRRKASESDEEKTVTPKVDEIPQKTPRTPRRRSLRKSANISVSEPGSEPVVSMEVIEEEKEADEVFQSKESMEMEPSAPEQSVEGSEKDSLSKQTDDDKPAEDKENSTPSRSRRCSTSDACFRQPGLPMSAQRSSRKRRRTESSADPSISRSPEEWVKILSTSPMVEMRRRTPKAPRLSAEPISQSLNFDDMLDESMEMMACEDNGDKEKTDTKTDEQEVTKSEEKPEAEATETPVAMVTETLKSEGERDVTYFRNLLITETARLNVISAEWTKTSETENISDDIEGEIRTTVGQAQLLIAQRFKQFTGLVDNCEFGTGEKETTCTDLQGFWDMIYFQVEDVDKKFAQLTTLQKNNWKEEVKPSEPTKKVVKKKTVGISKPKVRAGPSKFAAFRAQMKKQKEEEAAASADNVEKVKVFDAGFFKVSSPLKSPAPHCEGGSPAKMKPTSDQVTTAAETKTTSVVSPTDVDVAKTLLMKTPKRKSYVPTVPSPLLRDITPKPKGRHSIAQAPSSGKKPETKTSPLSIFTPPQQNSPEPASVITPLSANKNQTPKRRSIRLRKSLSLTPTVEEQQELAAKSEESGLDPRFFEPSGSAMETDDHNSSNTNLAKFLEPSTQAQDTEDMDSSLSKFLQPAGECVHTGGRKSALKKLPSSQRLRSSRRSVQFASSAQRSPDSHPRLPSTPFNNKETTVAQRRVSHGECYLFTPPTEDEGSQISPADGSSPILTGRPRPSLLYTPHHNESNSGHKGDNLMVFTP